MNNNKLFKINVSKYQPEIKLTFDLIMVYLNV